MLLSAAAVWQPSLVIQPVSCPCEVLLPLRRIHIFKYVKGRNSDMLFLTRNTNIANGGISEALYFTHPIFHSSVGRTF